MWPLNLGNEEEEECHVERDDTRRREQPDDGQNKDPELKDERPSLVDGGFPSGNEEGHVVHAKTAGLDVLTEGRQRPDPDVSIKVDTAGTPAGSPPSASHFPEVVRLAPRNSSGMGPMQEAWLKNWSMKSWALRPHMTDDVRPLHCGS